VENSDIQKSSGQNSPHHIIHKFTWSSDGKSQCQIHHILIGRSLLSIVHDIRSLRSLSGGGRSCREYGSE
jgi:hypothetical protein